MLAVAVVTLMNYPGIIWMTPAAWLLAPTVGARSARDSRSPSRRRRVVEAGLGGALLGLLQGVTFAAALLSSPGLQPAEFGQAAALSAVMAASGAVVCASLSTLAGWLVARRIG